MNKYFYMTNFLKLCDKLMTLHEQTEPNAGIRVANEFMQKAPKAVRELIKRFYEGKIALADKANQALGKRQFKKLEVLNQKLQEYDQEFIRDYFDPAAVQHEIDSLPTNFTPQDLKEFIDHIYKEASRQDEAENEGNWFYRTDPKLVKAVYGSNLKKFDRKNFPGGERAYEAVKFGAPEKVNEILKAYRIERTHATDEEGRPNSVIGFLSRYIIPVLKQLNWPIRDVQETSNPISLQKWASVYLKDFMVKASQEAGVPYENATLWKGSPLDTYRARMLMQQIQQEPLQPAQPPAK